MRPFANSHHICRYSWCFNDVIILGLGFKHFKNSMPLAGSCSAAISVACHPPPGGGDALKPVMWGEMLKSPVNNNHTKISCQEDDGEDTVHTASGSGTRSGSDEENPNTIHRQGNNSYLPGKENGSEYGHCSFFFGRSHCPERWEAIPLSIQWPRNKRITGDKIFEWTWQEFENFF